MKKAKRTNNVMNATIKIHNRRPKNEVCLESFSLRYDTCDDMPDSDERKRGIYCIFCFMKEEKRAKSQGFSCRRTYKQKRLNLARSLGVYFKYLDVPTN